MIFAGGFFAKRDFKSQAVIANQSAFLSPARRIKLIKTKLILTGWID
jgi:hypothetical protein